MNIVFQYRPTKKAAIKHKKRVGIISSAPKVVA
jgi:hypothetical protein